MKKTVLALILVLLVASFGATGWSLLEHTPDPTPEAAFPAPSTNLRQLAIAAATGLADPAATSRARGFGVGDTLTIDLQMDEASLTGLEPQGRTDQFRDWLLIAAISSLEGDAQRLNQILFDLPPVRYGYLRPAGYFEYGPTRGRVIGDGTAVALIPATQSDALRRDYIANVGDRLSKDIGGVFKTLVVVEYALPEHKAIATLHRLPDVAGSDIFTADYGYKEGSVGTLAELQQLLTEIDDITYVRLGGDKLLIGGRRLLTHCYRGITAEHIATVWQAERKVQSALAAFDTEVKAKAADFDRKWENRHYSDFERELAQRQHDAELEELIKNIRAERQKLKLVDGTGFSLDPFYDFRGMATDFEAFSEQFKPRLGDSVTDTEVTEILAALRNRDVIPFLKFKQKIDEAADVGGRPEAIIQKAIGDIAKRNKYQSARYDGDLQGTEVGMILFYTDLLAKIWSHDMFSSAPAKVIPAFVDSRHLNLSMIYKAEAKKYSKSRLWFGPSDRGFQSVDSGKALRFSRVSTRIYNAGSDPIHPEHEVTTSAALGTSVNWWNDHYEEVAAYEQEYERLNEIMKWSIIISWLSDKGRSDDLKFLDDVKINRSNKMPDWAKSQPDLKFTAWDKVKFYPPGYKETSTETIDIIYTDVFTQFGESRIIYGGVSLAPKALFEERAVVSEELSTLLRRSDLDYTKFDVAGSRLTSLEKSVYDLTEIGPGEAKVVTKLAPETKLRSHATQIANVSIERKLTRGEFGRSFELKAAEVPVGNLSVVPTPNGLRIGWMARDLDAGQDLARTLSVAPVPDGALAQDFRVQAFVKLGDDEHFAVKLKNSDRWLEFKLEGKPSVEISEGWLGRAAGSDAADDCIEFRALDNEKLVAQLADGKEVVLGPRQNWFSIGEEARGSDAKDVVLDAGDLHFTGWLDKDGQIHVKWGDLPQKMRQDPEALARRFARADWFDAVVAQHDASTVHLTAAELGTDRDALLIAALDRGRQHQLAMLFGDDPVHGKTILDRYLDRALSDTDDMIRAGADGMVLQRLDGLVDEFGWLPELTLRRAVAQLNRSNLSGAAEAVRDLNTPLKGGDELSSLLDEIGERSRVAGDPRIRDSFERLDAMARWNVKRGADRADGSIQAFVDRGRLDLQYRVNELPNGQQATFDELIQAQRRGAAIYRQDSAGLNNVDWSPALETTLKQLVTADLGRVVKLPAGDISQFQPVVIYTPAKTAATGTRWVRQSRFPENYGLPSSGSAQQNQELPQDPATDLPVYVIVDKNG